MFFSIFSHVFRHPHKRHGWGRFVREIILVKGSHVPEKRTGGARVGHSSRPLRRETGMSNEKSPIDPNRLTVEQAAKLLSAAAKIRVSTEQIMEDLEAGAPRNPDGTINLMHYAAWMVKEMGRGN